MGEFKAILTGCRIAGDPTFIPGVDARNHHAIVTVMVNRVDRQGNSHSDDITVHFWGKGANIAANYLTKGKQCNIEGRLQSYTTDTGTTRADGRKILNRKVEVTSIRCELLGDSMKDIQKAFDEGVIALKSQGRLDPNAQINLVDILPKKGPMVDFNPALSAQTGKYGHANVWSKDKGLWKPAGAGTAAPNANATAVAALQAQIDQLKGGAAAPGDNVNPFA
jgi:single-stranded DNA-binding protein